MKNKKTKVVVTGGAGFIGSNLVDALVEEAIPNNFSKLFGRPTPKGFRDFDVHIIDNLSNGKKENVNKEAKLHILDITNLDSIRPVFKEAEYVFHLAALPRVQFSIEHPVESNNANVTGTLNVLIASKEAGVKRLIYSASSSAYGDQKILPLKEGMKENPKSPYGLQKFIGELYCRLWNEVYGLETVSLRYFNVYGPKQSSEGAYALVIAKFLKLVEEGKPITITGTGKQTRDFTHVSDVVRANILAMKSKKVGRGEVINIGCGNNQSILKIAKLIGGPIEFIPARLEPQNTLADNSLAKKLLGWVPKVSIEEGIKWLK